MFPGAFLLDGCARSNVYINIDFSLSFSLSLSLSLHSTLKRLILAFTNVHGDIRNISLPAQLVEVRSRKKRSCVCM